MKTLIEYAKSFVHIPYVWGGSNPFVGLDCSGLVQVILASVGLDPAGDQTAQGLHAYFTDERNGSTFPKAACAGALAFFGSKNSVTHVGFCIDSFRMIEAGGGNRNCLTPADAARYQAYVRISPISRRSDLYALILPHYPATMLA